MNIRDDLKAFVDGELSPERMEEVRAAVDADPALKQEVEFMRVLGFEIKKLAAEPEVAGRAKAIEAVKAQGWPLWHPFGLGGRIVIAGGCAVILFAIFFPVFASSKEAAKNTIARSSEMVATLQGRALDGGGGGGTTGGTTTGTTGGGGAAADEAPNAATSPVPMAGREAPAKVVQKFKLRTSGDQAAAGSASGPVVTEQSTVPVPLGANNRMVVQNADLSVRVQEVKKAFNDALALARSLGGYVENSDMAGPEGTNPTAYVTMRVPSGRFDTAVKSLSNMGELIGAPHISGVDVTRQYADITGRVKVLHAEEDSYVTMLRGARKIGEIMEIKDRLSQVRQEISSLEEQRIALKDQSMLSTITARFEQKAKVGEPEKAKDWSSDSWATAVNGLAAVGRFLGNCAIYLFVFAPIWLPPVVLFWWLGKKAKA